MKGISLSRCAWLAALIWLAGIIMAAMLGWWNFTCALNDAENRLVSDAGRTASQISALLSYGPAALAPPTLKAIIGAAMEDERIYAIRITANNGIMEGERRNYLWEPVAWDDEIAENSVLGMDPIRIKGHAEGKVEVWLSPRLNGEEETLLKQREIIRFIAVAALLSGALLLLLGHWGIYRKLNASLAAPAPQQDDTDPVLALSRQEPPVACLTVEPGEWINPAASLGFCGSPRAWPVIAGLFCHTFGRAPLLMSRLFSSGELPALCHLGRMLEQAAPVAGAEPLGQAAQEMQAALNNPASRHTASAVDNCAQVLENTLNALGGEAPCNQPSGTSAQMPQQEA